MSWYDIPERPLEPSEDVVVGYCDHCGGEIYDGEAVYCIDGHRIHEDCLDDFAAEYFADCHDAEDESYAIDGAIVEDTDLGQFARLFFAVKREEAEIHVRTSARF